MIPSYKTIILPIKVPDSLYCWDYRPPHAICQYFNNEGVNVSCDLNLGDPIEDEPNGVLKPEKCRTLTNVV